MRLMLGREEARPWLLVSVDPEKMTSQDDFEFYVVNGCWEGRFYYGNISVFGAPDGDVTYLGTVKIICQNQDRLRGKYEDVFYHYKNPNYVAPQPKPLPASWDDDIPF